MRDKKDIISARLFLAISFIILVLGFSCNFWRVSRADQFKHFDDYSESLSTGRMARSAADGVFSYGALPGVNYDTTQYGADTTDILFMTYADQERIFVENDIPDGFDLYMSQSGGQLFMFSVINNALPFDHSINFHIIHTLNAILSAICFTLFLGWAYRNFGWLSALITLLLITLSPWITMYGYSLWWAVWTMYIPFVVSLLVLERNEHIPMKTAKVILYLSLGVFAKCVFDGFEFITTSLVAMIAPVVYYSFLKKEKLTSFIFFSAKVTLASIFAVLLQMIMLVLQICSVKGTLRAGVEHIVHSYERRTQMGIEVASSDYNYLNLFKKYIKGNAFELGFLPETTFRFYFVYLFAFIGGAALVVYCLAKGLNDVCRRKNIALLLTTVFSVLAPLSWLIIFKQHSANHPHLDYIVWYLPFLLYGFLVIGQSVTLLLSRLGIVNKNN